MHKHQLEREMERIELENERQWLLLEELSHGQFSRNSLLSKLDYIIKQNKQIMIDLTKIQDAVAKETTIANSAVALIKALAEQIRNIPPSTDPTTQAALDGLATTLETNDQALADAVTANTTPPADQGTV